MAIKQYKPTSSGIRGMSVVDYSHLTKGKRQRSLTEILKKHSGRDSRGRVSIRHQGGGTRRFYRLVELGHTQFFTGKITAIEYDPNRSAFISLVAAGDRKYYILATQENKIGDEITYAERATATPGNRMQLKSIPPGMNIHNVELLPGGGGRIARSAGSFTQILAKEGDYATVKMPSGEVRKIHVSAYASIGTVSNPDHKSVVIGKAGRMRKMGWRPVVRGKAMHPAAHPHGGGEGVNPIGLKQPKTKWGKPARGVRTRRPKKISGKFIISRRRK
ncbi:50S ribosomal protein L2 [Candidatus Berkelbacteria bacterium]|nr:50S ribosomal protein L2 [Candidatus Berkelbacteria bacterium]